MLRDWLAYACLPFETSIILSFHVFFLREILTIKKPKQELNQQLYKKPKLMRADWSCLSTIRITIKLFFSEKCSMHEGGRLEPPEKNCNHYVLPRCSKYRDNIAHKCGCLCVGSTAEYL